MYLYGGSPLILSLWRFGIPLRVYTMCLLYKTVALIKWSEHFFSHGSQDYVGVDRSSSLCCHYLFTIYCDVTALQLNHNHKLQFYSLNVPCPLFLCLLTFCIWVYCTSNYWISFNSEMFLSVLTAVHFLLLFPVFTLTVRYMHEDTCDLNISNKCYKPNSQT